MSCSSRLDARSLKGRGGSGITALGAVNEMHMIVP